MGVHEIRSPDDAAEPDVFVRRRAEMIRTIAARGIRNGRVLAAWAAIDRHHFVPAERIHDAYVDRALPIGSGQTISQPFMVAIMATAARLQPGDTVVEIGAGSGYGAAVLGCLAGRVITVERDPDLAAGAARRLAADGYDNVEVVVGDGTAGWPADAPYDAIVVTAAPRRVPPGLLDQLVDGGRLVIPLGRARQVQRLWRFERDGATVGRTALGPVRFVPLISG
ncbi:MAG: protein-L-isoaspartate(D-aspartate) O-methyltransferase [Acidimicrobiales bacterium]